MSTSKRSLIFVFVITTAFLCLVHDQEAVAQAQNFRGLEMPEVYFLTARPYEPPAELIKNDRVARRAVRDSLTAWSREGSNRKALTAIRTGQNKVKDVLSKGGDATADTEARKFLDEYTFPSMTQTDADTVSSLGNKRREFLKDYLNERVTGAARSRFIDLAVEKLQAHSINPTLLPSARVNAVVLISQLTDRPLARDQAPIASAKAFDALLSIFSNADAKQSPEYIKIAAFSGIKSQLEMNAKSGQTIDPSAKTQLIEAAMAFMAAPADQENASAYWKKRQSVQLAGILKDAKTLPALLAILKDETSSRDLKLEVVRTFVKTGAMSNDQKSNSTVLAAICKFAGDEVASEASELQNSVDEMVRNTMLFGNQDMRQSGADFEPESAEDAGGRGNFNGGVGDARPNAIPLVELPNYQLKNVRNRIRAVAIFCQQAIGVNKENGLRRNLDTKAETLADGTVRQLNTLLANSNVGLINLDVRSSGRNRDEQRTPQEIDQDRTQSYVDQMIKVCEESAGNLSDELATYTAE